MQKIPLNDLSRISFDEAASITKKLGEIVQSGDYILGAHCRRFEAELASFIGADHAVAVASGTDALELGLRALGVKTGDTVATVANAGGYTTSALRVIGAIPLYIDCDDFGRMDPKHLERSLDDRPQVKAIVVTHLYGLSSHILKIRDLADVHQIPLLEDCAQSIGAEVEGLKLGSFGDVSTFSFYPTKNLGALGDAGAVVTSNEHLANNVKKLRQYGWSSRYHNDLEFGRNSRMDEFQAAILTERLQSLSSVNDIRRSIWSTFVEALSDSDFYMIGAPDSSFVAHLGVLVTPFGARDETLRVLESFGVQTGCHYPLLDSQQKAWFDPDVRLKVAKDLVERIVTIPLFPTMTSEEVETVSRALKVLSKGDIDVLAEN